MKKIRVAAAVILEEGKVLAAQRGYGAHKDGWEFPGGKIEEGETAREALAREIWEELSVRVSVEESLGVVEYDYPEFHLSMECFVCHILEGIPKFREAEDARWLTRTDLDSVDWLPADRLILDKVRESMEPLTILCYGDSNTYGYNPLNFRRYGEKVRWPMRLASLLGEDYRVVEEGCNGRTTVFKAPGEEWKCGLDSLKPCLNSHKPVAMAVLMLGTNDLKNCFHAEAEDVARGVEELVSEIQSFTAEKQQCPAKILLVAPPKIPETIRESYFASKFDEDTPERQRQLSPLCRKIAEKYGCSFLDAGEFAEVSGLDSLHLTANGHAAMAERVFEKVREAFGEE